MHYVKIFQRFCLPGSSELTSPDGASPTPGSSRHLRCHARNLLCLLPLALTLIATPAQAEPTKLRFDLQLTKAHQGFDGESCWVHARAGAIPAAALEPAAGAGPTRSGAAPRVVMTMQKLLLAGSDVFYGLNELRSDDLGASWSEPQELPSFARQSFRGLDQPLPTGAAIAPELLAAGDETVVCDFTPAWHAASGTLLGTGHNTWYRNNRGMKTRPRGVAYATYDPATEQWAPWQVLDLPDQPWFKDAGAGSGQRLDLDNGDILLAIYHKEPGQSQYSVTVCRCAFDGKQLRLLEHGNALTVDVKRGLYEPSLTRFGGRFYLTLRNDDHGYVSVSEDGLNYASPQKWTFDDGSHLGNYNTQQHWVTHSEGLFLVYTRRGADNDHVFRHRAPLFIAQVDPERLQVIHESEQVLVPQRGARLGNFGVCDVSPEQTWVTVSEWMQPAGVEKHGSDNSVFIAKLQWNRPNTLVAPAQTTLVVQQDAAEEAATEPAAPPASDPASTLPESLARYASPPPELADARGDYRSPLIFADGSRVQTPEDWQRRRQEILDQWTELLGQWPALITEPEVEILESERRENFMQHKIRFLWTPTEKTTAYLLIPDGEGKRPAVVTVFYDPESAVGLKRENRDFAYQLARRGFVALSIGTTEASEARTYSLYYPSIEDAKVQPLSMLGYAAANAWYVLASRPEVDSERIGVLGHSFGGKWAMFAACLFDKFAATAWSDPGIVFDDTRPSINYWEPWYLGYHPKPWRKRGLITPENPAFGLYPQLRAAGRDLHELHALMAPRPLLVSGGAEDPVERWVPLNHTRDVNRLLGYHDRVLMTNRPEHSPNPESNEVMYEFFEHFLKAGE